MSDYPLSLAQFHSQWLANQRIDWPENGWDASAYLRFADGDTHLVYMRHAPKRSSIRPEPIHESIVIETPRHLSDASAGDELPITRVLYQATASMLRYRSATAEGSVFVQERQGALYSLRFGLEFTDPVVNEDNISGPRFSGLITVAL